MPRKKRSGKQTSEIEPYQSTAELMLKMIEDQDNWLINNYKTGIIAWTIFVIANTIMTGYIWYQFGMNNPISILLIFFVGVVWGAYLYALYQTKQKIKGIRAQMAAIKQREEEFLKRF